MHFKKIIAQIVGASAIIVLTSGSAYANLLSNGSFEDAPFGGDETPGAGTSWNSYGPAFRIQCPAADPGCGAPISGTPGVGAHDGSAVYKTWEGGVFQDVAVTPGQAYTLSAWMINPNNGDVVGGNGELFIDWRDNLNLADPGASASLGVDAAPFFTAAEPTDVWTLRSVTAIAPAGAAAARVQSQFFGGGAYRLDSMSLTAVPVPAAVWLFGTGLLGLVGVARRRKA